MTTRQGPERRIIMKNRFKAIISLMIPILLFTGGCSSETPYTSLTGNNTSQSLSADTVRLKSLVFKADDNTALTTDNTAVINGKRIFLNLVTGTDNSTLVPTLSFCSDSDCSENKTADELNLHYKPRYRSTDTSFYSCPAPIPGREYDKSTGWFEHAVTNELCIKEDRNTLFKEPVTYVITAADGSSIEYNMQTTFTAGTSSDLLTLSFLQEYNSGITDDVSKDVSSSPVNISMPFGTDLTSLVPSFTINGSKVTLGADETGSLITSSETAADFSSTVSLFVHNLGGSNGSGSDEGSQYDVSISTSAPFSSFNIEKSKNSGLSKDYTGVIDHSAKTVSFVLESGDDVSAAIPTIDLTDSSITVSPSASSAQNFSTSLTYKFTNSAGASESYTVQGVTGLSAGDLVITEVMSNTDTISDTDGEYLELYNSTDSIIDLNVQPITLSDDNGDFTTISSGSIAANDYFLICRNADSGENGGITECDHEPSSMLLTDAETITITQDTTTIDSFSYTSETAGVSWELATNKYSSDNSDETFWGPATSNYDTNNNGTPGAANDYTYETPAQVVISEVQCDGSSGPEDYIELYVQSGGSMAGWKVKERTSTLYTFDNSFSPSTGDYIVMHHDSANQGTYTNEDLSGNNITSSSATDSVATAYDVYSTDTSFTCTDNIAILENISATIVDLVPVSNQDGDAASGSMGDYHTIWDDSATYKWSFSEEPADGTNDATIQGECAAVNTSAQREDVTADTNSATDFCDNTATMGVANNCP